VRVQEVSSIALTCFTTSQQLDILHIIICPEAIILTTFTGHISNQKMLEAFDDYLHMCYITRQEGCRVNGRGHAPSFVDLKLHRVPISVGTHLTTAQVLAEERMKSARSEDGS
jgi:hypothetical protein